MKIVFSLLALLQFSSQNELYNFDPESRQIVINEGDLYMISFYPIAKITNFTHCYISSETINIDYDIITNGTEEYQEGDSGFSPFEGTACGFTYTEVNDKVPQKWVLIALDDITKKNYTEEVTITFYYNMPLYLTRWEGLETSTAVNFFEAGATQLKTCSLNFNDTKIDLDLDAITPSENNKFGSRLFSLGGGKCGYKINNLTHGDSTDLTLFATDTDGKTYRTTSQLVVITVDFLKNRTFEVYLGGSATVICGKSVDDGPTLDQQFCHLYNPQGDLVSRGSLCDFSLDIVTVEDLGTWRCSAGYEHVMEALDFTTQLTEKKLESIVPFSNNTTESDYYIIGCQFDGFQSNQISYCKFTRPDGKIFKVVKGAASPFYNTFTSDLKNGKCALEMLKPLRSEDYGSWKCEGDLDVGQSGGIFIDVKNGKSTREDVRDATSNKKNVRLGNNFFIDCEIPYSSHKCYIIAPNGTQYKPQDELAVTGGLCLFTVEHSTPTDSGEWKCSVAQENGTPDKIITIEISIIELTVFSSNIEAAENEEIDLLCNTNDVPIDYCRFVSPSGQSYSLTKDASTSNGISYTGRGLEYGDCGMKISKVQLEQSGQWNCHISPGRGRHASNDLTRTVELKIQLPRSAITLAESLGIGVGVVVACIAVGGVLFYKKSERFCRRGTTEEDRSARTSNESNGESVILSISHRGGYNT